jgi:hypothetical protein
MRRCAGRRTAERLDWREKKRKKKNLGVGIKWWSSLLFDLGCFFGSKTQETQL